MTDRTVRIIAIILAAVALLSLALGLKSCSDAGTAATRAKLATGQAGAAMESGKDAVETLGNRMTTDAAGDQITRENTDAIHKAAGADAQVGAAAHAAGLDSLCRRAAYRSDPKCVQRANPR